MSELKINVRSPLYIIYKQGLSRWECPPTKTDIYSFSYKIFKFYLRRFYKTAIIYLLLVIAMCYSLHTCVKALVGFPTLPLNLACEVSGIFVLGSVMLMFILFTIMGWIKRQHRQIASSKWYVRLSYRSGKLWERLTGVLTPTVKFVGHPSNESEIERFC